MGQYIKIKKGYDIKIVGAAAKTVKSSNTSDVFALKPSDFRNVTPKLLVNQGDEVLAGQKLFFDKDRPNIGFASPVSGEIIEIVRAEKRRISHVKILADKKIKYKGFVLPKILDKENVKELLLESGCWAYLRQRPYDMIPSAEATPKSIFVSFFDSAPLAPDYEFILADQGANIKKGLEVLSYLSDGKVNICTDNTNSNLLQGHASGNVHQFSGPHPAGNVGVQIHHIDPIQANEQVWYVNVQDLCIIGNLFNTGHYEPKRKIALVGSGVVDPQYYEVMTGQSLESILRKKILEDNQRIIEGNILTGITNQENDYLSFYTNQITVISEGNEPEFLGWLLPGFSKLSLSRSYFSWLSPKKVYNLNTNTHGELRPFVITDQYDKVLPMNILPNVLLKSILAQDIERMEQLGIYEASEEDFALCEFVCTSKIEVQKIIREGLELIRKES